MTRSVLTGLLQEHALAGEAYDLAMIVASIDHFQTPMRQLAQVRNILKPDGLIYVDGYDIMRAAEVGFEQFKVDHCYYYNAPLMLSMLYACGFTPVRFMYDNLYSFEVENQRYVRRLDNCCFRILARKNQETRGISEALDCFFRNRKLEISQYLNQLSGVRRVLRKVYSKLAYSA